MVQNFTNNLDIILLTESWISNESTDFLQIPSYTAFHTYRTHKKGGGLSLFVRSEYNTLQIPEYSFVNEFIEVNTVKICSQNVELFVLGTYRPPQCNYEKFLEKLETILENFKNKQVIISGDFNCDLLKIHEKAFAFNVFNSFLSFAFYPTITRLYFILPSRLNTKNPKNSSLLDHTWTNINGFLESNIILSDISDHYPCLTVFKTSEPIKKLD